MTEKAQWSLKEIRDAYGEIFRAYNALFPLHPEARMHREDMIGAFDFDRGDDNFHATFHAKVKKILPKLKGAADRSGNSVTWRRGEPLDSLNKAMRDRIGKALRLGI